MVAYLFLFIIIIVFLCSLFLLIFLSIFFYLFFFIGFLGFPENPVGFDFGKIPFVSTLFY